MKKTIFALLLLGLSLSSAAIELPNIDRTDKVHERRYLDSINVYHRRAIRVNQVGFRPQDLKFAYVADPSETNFKVIDANSGTEALSGTLTLIDDHVIKPNMWVDGAFNSITTMYHMGSRDTSTKTEALYRADFSALSPSTPGQYFIVVGNDTSATFDIHPYVFNAILENALKFFGIQRCGNTKSHFHAACHLKDGSAIGHDLTGGWHDCGDHFKPSETLGYVAYALITTYLVYKDKAEDRYGESYDDTVIVDGVPDILWEAKIGADYIFKLYKASKADGLIEKHDMWHTVGSILDHAFWDQPERQDAQAYEHGGPDRDVSDSIGSYAGSFAATLAYFSVAWKDYNPVYADSLLEAAKDIYKNVAYYHSPAVHGYQSSSIPSDLYPGGNSEFNMNDDLAAGALALWYATKDTSYQFDLYKDLKIHDNRVNYGNNNEPGDAGAYFRGGFLGVLSGFYPGGWMTDYENVHTYVLFSFLKLILADKDTALTYNVGELERDTLIQRATNALRRATADGTKGDKVIWNNRWGTIHAVPPYDILYPTAWGLNRYNMGSANAVFMLSEVLPDGPEKQAYFNLALENIYYTLGANPWDISFMMGAGDKNQNHPHNRTSNPDGYDAGGKPYKYRCPRGALMGGYFPDMTLEDYWQDYTKTETCIDFSAQLLIPVQRLAEVLPPDNEGPLFSNIQGTPISETSAIVSWDADEVTLVTVFYSTTPDKMNAKSVQQDHASKGGAVTLEGLEMGKTYYFFLEGVDVSPKHNITTDDNHGQWYQFTMTLEPVTISGVTICQVDNRSAKIYWWTNVRSNGVVKYGTSMSALNASQSSTDGAVLFHEVELKNLSPGTTYYFSVSSGMSEDKNGGSGYSFTTESEASYADLVITIKPSAYQDETECNHANGWKNCREFIVEIDNNDTLVFEDFELRLYLGAKADAIAPASDIKHVFDGKGKEQMNWSTQLVTFGPQTADATGQYYLPITIKDKLYVSGRIIFQIKWNYGLNFGDFSGDGWSLRPHLDPDDPVPFEGVDLTNAPYFTGSETDQVERFPNGDTLPAFIENPYIPVYYHGKHIFGYSPEDTPETGPQVHRTISINFEEPFKSPYYSVEKLDYKTTYKGTSKVTPTGFLDDFEMNGVSQFGRTIYDPDTRKDAFIFGLDTTLAYGNNYMEWVSWHNHGANLSGSYDCACAVVRSNVEIDTITTPPEERYLSFTTNPISAYTGKKAEVHVQLFDSTLTPITTERVSLQISSENGLAKFYATSDATVSEGNGFTVDIVNGEAVFYVSADVSMETLLHALGPTTSKVRYNDSPTKLIIQDLPPWPIIDLARMVDTDCNGVPDAFDITLSNEYMADQQQSFNSVKFVYGNDTLTSNKVISQSGKNLIVAADIADTSINSNPTGSITLISNIAGKQESSTDFYQDGIAPTLVSASVLERLDTATTDRVYLQFSEPIQAPGLSWPTKVMPNDKSITVKAAKLYNDSLNIWEYEIEFDAGGASQITEGMQVQLLSTSNIHDLAGNGIGDCPPAILPVLLKIRPVPMTYASISDPNEDGIADRVDITFSQAVDAKHTPEKISIEFGSATPETLWVEKSQFKFDAAKTSVSISLSPTFALGNTNGPYEGIVAGKNLVGAGLVMQHLGTGASYESNTVLAEDKVGPIFVSASVQNSNFNTANMNFSEPVNIIDSSRVLFLRERDDLFAKRTDVYRWALRPSILNIIDTSESFIMDGDRVRLAPLDQSAFVDMSGNSPATNNPWVTVGGEGDPKITFNVYVRDRLSRINTAVGNATPEDPTMVLYIMNPFTRKLDAINASTGTVIKQGIDTTVTPLTGAVWVFDLTVPRGGSVGENAAWSSLDISYDLPIYTNLGSFVNRLSGKYSINPATYLSSTNKITMFVEWTNVAGIGVRSQNGRAVGTGAYIYKAELKTKFIPNTEKDAKTQERFSVGESFDKTKVFGIKRQNGTN